MKFWQHCKDVDLPIRIASTVDIDVAPHLTAVERVFLTDTTKSLLLNTSVKHFFLQLFNYKISL